VKKFLDGLSDEDAAGVIAAMKMVAKEGTRAAKHVEGEIYELRAYPNRPARPTRPIRGAGNRRAVHRTTSAPLKPSGHWHPRLDRLECTFLPG
jgi:hypothetical protein